MKVTSYMYLFPKREAKKRFKNLKNHSNARNVRLINKCVIKYSKDDIDYVEFFVRP